MELKLKIQSSLRRMDASSNRTFMELKWRQRALPMYSLTGSNRTFMELKFVMPTWGLKKGEF